MLFNQFTGAIGSSTATNDALRQVFLTILMKNSPLLNYIQFSQKFGNSFSERKVNTYTEEGETAGFGFRALDANGGGGASAGASYSAPINLAILAYQISTDIANQRRGYDVADEKLLQLEDKSVDIAKDLTDKIINSDGTNNSFTGLKALIPAGQTFTLGSGNGLTLSTDNESASKKAAHTFYTELTRIASSINGGASAIIVNYQMKAFIYGMLKDYLRVTQVKDAFGNYMEIDSFMGIPIVDAGYKNNSNELVLPQNETIGTSTDCGSIYIFHSEERKGFHGVSNVGAVVYDENISLNNNHAFGTKIECDMAFANTDNKMVARINGIRFN